MSELQVDAEGRYVGGDIPLGYARWGDRLVEVPAELDACVTAIRLAKAGQNYAQIAPVLRAQHGVEVSPQQYDAFMLSVYRRYGPLGASNSVPTSGGAR